MLVVAVCASGPTARTRALRPSALGQFNTERPCPVVAAFGQLAFLVLMVGGFYALAIRPQKARIRALQATQAALAPGQRVITTAGLHATVVGVDDADVRLEVAPGVVLRFARGAIAQTVSEPSPGEDAEVEATTLTLPPG